jgi:murein DD-endopeptidase MepM/ murein hydrolase activator NlpD
MRRRHVLLVVDPAEQVICTLPIGLRVLISLCALVITVPTLIGLGARLSVKAEVAHLQAIHRMLEQENASYRSEILAFTDQVHSLDGLIDELQLNREASAPRSTSARMIDTLYRVRAAGGTVSAGFGTAVPAALSPSLSSPKEALELLRSTLQALDSKLPSIVHDLERREALAAASPSIWPAQGWLTDRFGVRKDPLTGQAAFHPGLDISTPVGQPVYATADGTVDVAAYSGDFGNLVELQHGFGLSTRYAHLSRFAVIPGAAVKRGDVVGYVGATGRATGSHVHYEILANGTSIDPLQLLTSVARPKP